MISTTGVSNDADEEDACDVPDLFVVLRLAIAFPGYEFDVAGSGSAWDN